MAMSIKPIPTAQQQLSEVSDILALGFLRLVQREQQHCSGAEKVELDFTADQSVSATVSKGNGRAKWQSGEA